MDYIIKECDKMLEDSELFINWTARLPDFIDKLPENDKKKFAVLLDVMDTFAKVDDEIHELKLAATYVQNESGDIAERRLEIKRELVESHHSARALVRELKKPIEKQPEIESSQRYNASETSFGEVPESNIALMSNEKTGHVRKSRRRSVSASAVKAVKKAVRFVRRSVSHGRKPPTLFD